MLHKLRDIKSEGHEVIYNTDLDLLFEPLEGHALVSYKPPGNASRYRRNNLEDNMSGYDKHCHHNLATYSIEDYYYCSLRKA